MEENSVLDASSLDSFDEYDLTGEYDVEDAPTTFAGTEITDEKQESEDDLPKQGLEPEGYMPNQQQETEELTDDDFTTKVLKLRGINDPNKIKFVDQTGAEVERAWDDLTENEQLRILTSQEDPERDLDDSEIELINTLRSNNLTPQQYIRAIQQQAAQDAIQQLQQNQQPTYEIDSYSDDEVFVLDLLEKVGEENITDDELKDALEQAKSNPALFAKLIEGLRATYKNLEDQQKYNSEQARMEQAEQQYQEFAGKVLNEISSISSIANQEIELSTNDKNDIANYMLTRRETGISDFYTDIQNPAVATAAAFWLLKGSEVLSEMENQIKAAYQRGFAMGKNQSRPAPAQAPQVVVQTPSQNHLSTFDAQSALGLGDESYLN